MKKLSRKKIFKKGNIKNTSSFDLAPFPRYNTEDLLNHNKEKYSDKVIYHMNIIGQSGQNYHFHKENVTKALKQFKNSFIRMNYNLNLQKYIEQYNKLPTKEYKKQLYKNIESDFNNQFKKDGKKILSSFKKGR